MSFSIFQPTNSGDVLTSGGCRHFGREGHFERNSIRGTSDAPACSDAQAIPDAKAGPEVAEHPSEIRLGFLNQVLKFFFAKT